METEDNKANEEFFDCRLDSKKIVKRKRRWFGCGKAKVFITQPTKKSVERLEGLQAGQPLALKREVNERGRRFNREIRERRMGLLNLA
jgi:hypothetical protein